MRPEAFREQCVLLAPGIKWGSHVSGLTTMHIRGKLREGWALDGVAATVDVDYRARDGRTHVGVCFDDSSRDYQLTYASLENGLHSINALCRITAPGCHVCCSIPSPLLPEITELVEVSCGINGGQPEGRRARDRIWDELVPLFYKTNDAINYRIDGPNLMEQDHPTIRGEAITYPPLVGQSEGIEGIRARFRHRPAGA